MVTQKQQEDHFENGKNRRNREAGNIQSRLENNSGNAQSRLESNSGNAQSRLNVDSENMQSKTGDGFVDMRNQDGNDLNIWQTKEAGESGTAVDNLELRYQELLDYLIPFQKDGICIAYSGGVDSTLLLKAAVECSRKPVLAVILETQLHPHSDTDTAISRAEALGAAWEVIRVDEFQDPQIMQNPLDRCYRCKRLLFSRLRELAEARGYEAVFDGTNKDDENEYRPGRRALRELEIRSPLLELGIRKAQVREISAFLGLETASLPSTPCLATRLPYGAHLDRELLARIHQGEAALRGMGFHNVRLRFHDPVLRIEIDKDAFTELLGKRELVIETLKQLGFLYLTLDLEGFRSGSMDIGANILEYEISGGLSL